VGLLAILGKSNFRMRARYYSCHNGLLL
jgi:hypothetical protein